ncbi:MAG TPA: hypothetical protein VLK33_00615 [Terriglobales bacterium]|nr:hypothetical protein [Terriglobales bacterium]
MKDIFEVIRTKQAQQAKIAKEIELLQEAAAKLREVAHLMGDSAETDDGSVLGEDEAPNAMAANASGSKSGKSAPRWP